jgi:hypothetical protein
MSEELINKGITILGEAKKTKRPIVVVGAVRGGTSMIAGALAKLGVFMGDCAFPTVYEDKRLSEVFEKNDIDCAKSIINEYTSKFEKWGWKRPSSIDYLDIVEKTMDSPSYVFIFKDVLSIAQRNSISMHSEVFYGMQTALNQYGNALKFLRENNLHVLLVSYEKAVAYPENIVEALISFYSLSPTEQQYTEAVNFISPSPISYLDESRITKAEGWLDGLSGRRIFGWARYIHDKKLAKVKLMLNGKVLGTVEASQPREDIEKKYGTSCAYFFDLPEGVDIKKGDEIRARVTDEVKDLENSPLSC